jgi:hypothetical protein
MGGAMMEQRFIPASVVIYIFLLLSFSLLAACVRTQPAVEAPPLVYDPEEVLNADADINTPVDEPSPTPLPEPSPTPDSDASGSGLINIMGYYEIRSNTVNEDYDMGIDIPFIISWNGEKKVWEAKGKDTRCDGSRELTEGNCVCSGIYTGNALMTAIIIPPDTLIADPGGCKMVAHFNIDWEGYPLACQGCDSVNVVPASANIGPITLDLVKGYRTTETSTPYYSTHTVVETFNFNLAELSLPEQILCFDISQEE